MREYNEYQDKTILVTGGAGCVGSNLTRKFADLGLVRGTLLTMEGHAPFGDLIRIRVMGSSLSIRKKEAKCIMVKKTFVLDDLA